MEAWNTCNHCLPARRIALTLRPFILTRQDARLAALSDRSPLIPFLSALSFDLVLNVYPSIAAA